ncbi:hypothetical protein LCL61_36935 [Amycolatopsis coloradensis]|uniref:Uncharacterized protein n=1 Tax=Amycolatopsis coloradensis TaxID=76021 RepID=A0ACD5BP61_9PSEU
MRHFGSDVVTVAAELVDAYVDVFTAPPWEHRDPDETRSAFRERLEADAQRPGFRAILAFSDTGEVVRAGSAAALYLGRAGALDTVPWFITALRDAKDRTLVAQLHEAAWRHHDIGRVAWEQQWREHSNEPAPAWLTVDRGLLREAVEWVFTPTYVREKQHLIGHPRLLETVADVAVAEALLKVDEQEAERLQAIRAKATLSGVTQAYEPVLLASLVETFIAAPVDEQRQLLAVHRDRLRSAEAQSLIENRSQANSRIRDCKTSGVTPDHGSAPDDRHDVRCGERWGLEARDGFGRLGRAARRAAAEQRQGQRAEADR